MSKTTESDAKSELVALCRQYSDAYLTRSVSSLDAILADDWTLITAGCGGEVNKIGQLSDLEDGTLQVDGIEDSEVRVRVYGDAAVVTGRRRSKVTYKGHDVSDDARFSQFYALQNGQWRCASTHVTSLLNGSGYETDRQVLAICRQYSDAYLTRSVSSLDAILADDWTLITAGCGGEVNKIGQLSDLEDGTLQVDGIEDSEVRVRVYGDAAVVTGRRRSKVTYKGHDVSDDARFSQFYALQNGQWRCASTHVTSIRPDPYGQTG